MTSKRTTQPTPPDVSFQALHMAMMRAAVAQPEPERKRGSRKKPPRLIVEKPKTKGGQWIYYIRDGKHEETTRCVVGRDDEEAKIRLAFYKLRQEGKARAMIEPRKASVALALELLYEAERPANDAPKKRRDAYQELGSRLSTLVTFFGSMTFGDVDKAATTCFIEWRSAQPDARFRSDDPGRPPPTVSPATARFELKTLRKAMKLYAERNELSWYPKIELPKEGEGRKRFLTRDELARLLWAARGRVWDAAKNGWATETVVDGSGRAVERRILRPVETRQARRAIYRFVVIGYHTGTRHKALRELSWSARGEGGCIDVDGCVIHRQGFGQDPAKGKPQHSSTISQKLAATLRRMRDADLAAGIEHVIHQPDGTPYKGRLKTIWASVVADAGLDAEVVPHTLRHTAATHLRIMKVDVRACADLLGMSVQTAQRYYAHWTLEGNGGAANALAYGIGLKGNVLLEGPRKPKPQAPRQAPAPEPDLDGFQLELPFDMPAVLVPVEQAPLAIPPTPFRPETPIAPPPPRQHPTETNREQRERRQRLGTAIRGVIGRPAVRAMPAREMMAPGAG
ncbi:tyrosine-type recombinase/integrase [Bosea sp. (in: a-proteobacteria)]